MMNAAALNKKRNSYRTLTMLCLCAELLAVVLLFTDPKALGLALGLVTFIGYFTITRMGKRKINDEVARIQMGNLGLEGYAYLGRQPVDKEALTASRLLPSRCRLDTPIFQHAAKGSLKGRQVTIGEITLSFPKTEGKQSREFNNGAFVIAQLDKEAKTPLVLLGNKPYMVALTRQDYANDGYTQCPVGGKNKGWYAFTPGNVIPGDALLAAWEKLSTAAGGQAALAVKGNTVYAFFCSLFTTDTFQLSEEISESDLKKRVFPHLPLLIDVINELEAE